MTVIDGARERARTPGCASGHHLNSAGAALPTSDTLDTVIEYLRLEAFTGGYETARGSIERIERTYEAIATLVGCAPDEVALMDSATRAWQTAIASLRLKAGDRVIVTRSEYVSNALMLLTLEREVGIVIEIVGTTPDGTVDLGELEAPPGREATRSWSRSATSRRSRGWSSRSPRSGSWRAATASPSSSTRRSRSASCRSTPS